MSMKHIRIFLAVLGLSSSLILTAEDESKLLQQNPDWHISSEVFSNPPYWLMPTNVPYELYPLLNGKWVWTTNMHAPWFGDIDTGVDDVKRRLVKQQWQKQHRKINDANDPPGISRVAEYMNRTWDQKHYWNTNMAENWWGIWSEDTNTGWRVVLKSCDTNTPDMSMTVNVGSVITNSGPGLLPTPDGKFTKLELLDANGKTVSTRVNAAMNLYHILYIEQKVGSIVNLHPPSAEDASMERNYPDTISDLEYPRWRVEGGTDYYKLGAFTHFAGFVSNGPPCQIGYINFNDFFYLKAEGDYTLTVQPVLYRMHYDGGTFQGYLDRVDLPSVTAKVHLLPNTK